METNNLESRLAKAVDLLNYISYLEDQINRENQKKDRSIFAIGFMVDAKWKAVRELDDIVRKPNETS